jgi:tetratricopeptide (TPR) repeat protein
LKTYSWIVLFAVAVAWTDGATIAQTVATGSQEAFSRGVELQQKGDLKGARQAYEIALKLSPQRVDALSNLGLVYSQLGQQERAIRCFHDALQIDPMQSVVRLNLGIAHMRAKQFELAQGELAKVVIAQPRNVAARNLLGMCLLKLDREEEGIAELEIVRRANPNDSDVSYTLASAYVKINQLDRAQPVIRQLETNDSAEARLIVGSYYLAKLDHRRAIKEFTLALERNPTLPEAHAQLGYAYFFDFKWDLSVKMCEEELALYPDDDNAVKLLGSLYRQRGRLDEAAALLEKANRLNPDDYEILFQMGLLAQAKNDYPQAVAILEKVTRLNADFPPAHITLVRVYNKLKRPEDAKREQEIVDRLNIERKNLPTVRDKALYEAFKTPQ